MSVTFFSQNLIETAASVTVTPAAPAATPITRLYDRDRSPQYASSGAAQTDIDIDLSASPGAVSAWSLLNHNISGVTASLFGDAGSPPVTLRDSVALTSSDFLRTFASLTLRYWRIRVPVMGSPPAIGEGFLGVPRVVTTRPAYAPPPGELDIGNVRRDESPGGFVWKVQRGAGRARVDYDWNVLPDADWTQLQGAFDDVLQGAKNFVLLDADGILRWVEFGFPATLQRKRVHTGLNRVSVSFQEAL